MKFHRVTYASATKNAEPQKKTLPQNINLYTASFIKKALLQKKSAEFNSVHNDIVGFCL